MNRIKLLLVTVILAMMMVIPAAAASPLKPASTATEVTVKKGTKTLKKKNDISDGVAKILYSKKATKSFVITATKGASIKVKGKGISVKKGQGVTVKKLANGKFKVIIAKGAKVNVTLKITANNRADRKLKVVTRTRK